VEDKPINETHPTQPLSFYGVGKLASEHYLRIYQSKGLQPTALRYFNVYGPNQNMDNLKQGMVSIYLAQLLSHDEIVVKGAKDRFRDFIYIDDIVRFTKGIVNDERSFGGVFNVGTGVKTTVESLLEKLLKISGIKKNVVFAPGTPGDQKGIYADISLVKKQFGFEPKCSLDEGLKKMVEWAKKQYAVR
jgi:UDP-glucose 4-epimerase